MDRNRELAPAVAPVRAMQSGLCQAARTLHALADDSGFAGLVEQLSSLPGAASFAPLQAAASLPVDLAAAPRDESASGGAHRQFVDALARAARSQHGASPAVAAPRAPRPAGVGSPPAAASQSPALASSARTAAALAGAASATAGVAPIAVATAPIADAAGESAAAAGIDRWQVLARVGELVAELEQPGTTADRPPTPASPLAPAPAASPRAFWPVSAAAAAGPATPPVARGQQPPLAGSRPQDERTAAAPLTLDSLVHDCWPAAEQRRGSAAGARAAAATTAAASSASVWPGSPARMPSMLSPQLGEAGRAYSRRNDVTVSANDRIVPGAGSGRVPPVSAAPAAADDDALADRLNRSLVEQAWRAGVDLT